MGRGQHHCPRARLNFVSKAFLLSIRPATVPSVADFIALADNLPQLAWMATAGGWIFWYNRQWYDCTGTTPAEMEGL